ncbi:uncharacterized [Tachysurus ichikawai]
MELFSLQSCSREVGGCMLKAAGALDILESRQLGFFERCCRAFLFAAVQLVYHVEMQVMSGGWEGGGCATLGMSMTLKTTTYLPSKFKTLIKNHERGYEEKSAYKRRQDCSCAARCQWLLEAAVVPEADPHSLLPAPTTDEIFSLRNVEQRGKNKSVRPERKMQSETGKKEACAGCTVCLQ